MKLPTDSTDAANGGASVRPNRRPPRSSAVARAVVGRGGAGSRCHPPAGAAAARSPPADGAAPAAVGRSALRRRAVGRTGTRTSSTT